MRVMVSLNLADIMTPTRPTKPPDVYEMPNDETAAPSPESELPINTEEINAEGVR